MSSKDAADEPLYDPDTMTVDELDLTDPKVVSAYLNHPVTEALFDDYGRAARQRPAAEQHRGISEALRTYEEVRARFIDVRDSFGPTEPARAEFQTLVERVEAHIEAANLRLLELDEEG